MDSFNATNADGAVVVKVSFNGDLRRFPFPKGAPFQALCEQVSTILALEKGAELVLRYTDDEGDLITLSSDWELNSAIKLGQMLRLTANVKGSQAPVQPSAPLPYPSVFGAPAPMDTVMAPAPPHPHAGPFGGPGPFGHAAPFGGPGFGGPVPPQPFGGPAHAGPFGGPGFGGPAARDVPFGGPAHAGPFGGQGHGPFGRPGGSFGRGGCGGWGRGRFSKEEWKQMKKEHKARFSPDEWAKLKEERKRMCKEFKERKEKKGGRGGHHAYFGPHHAHGPFGGHPFAGHPGDAEASKLTARFVKDISISDGAQIAAGALFVKTWRVRNEGEAWPAGCVLRLLTKHSDNMSSPEAIPVPFETVASGVEFDISVQLVAPPKPGRYTAYYKMCTAAGKKFGQRLWVSVVVPSNSSSSSSEGEKEADKYESLVDSILAMGFDVKRHRVFRLLQKFDGDVAKVAELLQTKVQRKALKEQKKAAKKCPK